MLALGEIHTGLLLSSAPLSIRDSERLVDLVLDEHTRRYERPIDHVSSPDRLFGVDCQLATRPPTRARGVGTVAARTAITGGHVVQGSAYARVRQSQTNRRSVWSHYLAQPGVLETIGTIGPAELACGFVDRPAQDHTLDLGSICARCIDDVQRSPILDRRAPLQAVRTRLRWTALLADDCAGTEASDQAVRTPGSAEQGDGTMRFTVESSTLRTVRITITDDQIGAAVTLCEDLALHDWLLTTLLTLIDKTLTYGTADPLGVKRLRPALDHLLHLWMPAARVEQAMMPVWESLEQRPGFSRQWHAAAGRIREQVMLSAMSMLGATLATGGAGGAGGGDGPNGR